MANRREFAPSFALAGWTLLVWVGRVRNILIDEDLTSGEKVPRLALAGGFVALAIVVFIATRQASVLLAGFTVLVWPIRGAQILLGDWEAGFKVVHSLLAVVSVALGAWVLRGVNRFRQ